MASLARDPARARERRFVGQDAAAEPAASLGGTFDMMRNISDGSSDSDGESRGRPTLRPIGASMDVLAVRGTPRLVSHAPRPHMHA